MPNYGAPGYGKNRYDMAGRLYSQMRFDRCACNNSKRTDQPLCDRCVLLAERGWRVIYAA